MGSDTSVPSAPGNKWGHPSDMLFPVTANRAPSAGYAQLGDGSAPASSRSPCPHIALTPFHGTWSMEFPSCLAPAPRTGFFFAFDERRSRAYIGYGFSEARGFLSDVWALDVLTLTWSELRLSGEIRSGRSGAKACLVGDRILIFGGYAKPDYFADLHTIDVTTGEVRTVAASGPAPSPRSSPIVAFHGNRYYLWGGYNSCWHSELCVLDFSTMVWEQHPQGITGRTAVPFVIMGDTLYSFGCSKSGGMLALDLNENCVEIRPTVGVEPPCAVTCAGMVRVGKYALFFGGKGKGEHTLIYACDLKKMWWFVFHVLPDNRSVTLADGRVSESGLFMLPRMHSFGYCYVRERREVLAFLGAPEKDPPPMFKIYIGEALAFLNLRDDMTDVLLMNRNI